MTLISLARPKHIRSGKLLRSGRMNSSNMRAMVVGMAQVSTSWQTRNCGPKISNVVII